ncbi:Protein with response regulator receiver domain [Desulfatibacillum aliphaticivorans]|uniref:Protein with response regulator receiver domain n=1 Tax=Desulfatibacillum aliphaticivorans TaxID=218208 RepID=B8FH56_DESAL|nr:response regulator [Desulfatibacillum aliphaticivorans]ACL02144.1 Protein with response regulator receiver domain [Desulfatibacillum aliphaticivorans]
MVNQDAAKILVMEKDGECSHLLAGRLGQLGYRTDIAGSCDEARAALERSEYAVVIACSEMPDWGGPKGMAGLRFSRRKPAMLVTCDQECRDEALKCLSKGAYDYLPRQCEKSRLEVTVERALTERALAQKTRRCKKAALGLVLSTPAWIGIGMVLAYLTV